MNDSFPVRISPGSSFAAHNMPCTWDDVKMRHVPPIVIVVTLGEDEHHHYVRVTG